MKHPFSPGFTCLLACLLAGCPASTPPTGPQGETPIAGQGAAAVTSAPVTRLGIDLGMLGGEKLGGATLVVIDSETETPLPVYASAPQAGAAIIAPDPSEVRFDNDGAIMLSLAGLTPGQTLRLVAEHQDKTLEAVWEVPDAAAGFRVQQAPIRLMMNEVSTAVSRTFRSLIRSSQGLQPRSRIPILRKAYQQLRRLESQLRDGLIRRPGLAHQLVRSRAGSRDSGTALKGLYTSLNLTQAVQDTVLDTIRAIAVAAKNPQNLIPNAPPIAPVPIEGLNLVVKVTSEGEVTVTNPRTGKTVQGDAPAEEQKAVNQPPADQGAPVPDPTQANITLK